MGETLSAAAALMRDHPRETMLPLLAIQAPLVIGTILVTILLYNSVFADEVYPQGGLIGVREGGAQAFAFTVVLAVGLVFGAVALAATIVSTGAAAQGKSLSITEALDSAFARLGGMLVLTAIFLVGAVLLALLAGTNLLLAVAAGVAALYLTSRVAITYQVYLLEGGGPVEALRSSWNRTPGHMLRLLGIILVGATLVLLVGLLVPVFPEPGSMSREWRMAVDALLQILQGGVAIPFVAFAHAAITLYYLRIREEPS
ncbi:MAG: hypothetical protein F4X03_13815 [Dehalococcoidia bacterium]|nr:hypothetical protein [Dehalococcoidia bacterium]MYD29967.1 hypothetical protein [Dehalococcoidia bacterium]